MSKYSNPTIQSLDQLFANHFGVSPMVQSSNGSLKSESVFSDSSLQRSDQTCTAASSHSSSDGNSPRTPEKGIHDQLHGFNHFVQQKTIEEEGSGAIGLVLGEEERSKKAQDLLNALAQLYSSPVGTPKLTRRRGSSIFRPKNHRNSSGRGSGDHSLNLIMEDALSPKSVPISLDERSENATANSEKQLNRSNRTSTSTSTSAFNQHLSKISAVQANKANGDSQNDGEDATIWPMDQGALYEVSKPEDVGVLSARRQSKVGTDSVRPMSLLSQVHYTVEAIPRRALTGEQNLSELITNFPHLCEAPRVVMYDDQGIALPPLKYEETSNEERKARKNALQVKIRGKKMHTLIKSMVVLESRSTHWKRIGSHASKKAPQDSNTNANRSTPTRQSSRHAAPKLPEVPDPWSMNFMHSNKDTLNIKGTAKRIFELNESKAYGQCPKCHGSGEDSCGTCKGCKPDECFWCEGSGREKVKQHLRCQPCNGSGQLACKSCKGSLKSPCRSCEGEGQGEYIAYIQIKVRRVDFAPVPITSIIPSANAQNAASIKEAAISRTWDAINKLTEASGSKHKHAFRPLAAACYCQTSWSDLVEVQAPLSVKTSNSSNGQKIGLLRSRSLTSLRGQKGAQSTKMKKYFFVLPSDTDLQPAEIDEDEFELALMPDIRSMNVTESPQKPKQEELPKSILLRAIPEQSKTKGHQRSYSERVETEQTSNKSIPVSQSFNSADVAAWQARVQPVSAPMHGLMKRPVSPTSQLASLPSTPDERYAMASWPEQQGQERSYFDSFSTSNTPVSPRTALPPPTSVVSFSSPFQQPQTVRKDYRNAF